MIKRKLDNKPDEKAGEIQVSIKRLAFLRECLQKSPSSKYASEWKMHIAWERKRLYKLFVHERIKLRD